MSMYLPNPALRPAEAEPAEFIELPDMANEGHRRASAPVEWRDGASVRLSPQARVDIIRSALDCITEFVANHGGDSEDVRSIIHDLHVHVTVTADRRGR